MLPTSRIKRRFSSKIYLFEGKNQRIKNELSLLINNTYKWDVNVYHTCIQEKEWEGAGRREYEKTKETTIIAINKI